jgi:hypothetical protein
MTSGEQNLRKTSAFLGLPKVVMFMYVVVAVSSAMGACQAPVARDDTRYFSDCVSLSDEKRVDAFRQSWIAAVLGATKEPNLCEGRSSGNEQYRFVWLRSFDEPVVIRAARESDGPMLYVRVLRGFRIIAVDETGEVVRYNSGELTRAEERKLQEDEWLALVKQVEASDFWEIPTVDESRGEDGAEWLMEGVKGGQYQAVARWSPRTGSFRELCLSLLQLAEGDFGPVY